MRKTAAVLLALGLLGMLGASGCRRADSGPVLPAETDSTAGTKESRETKTPEPAIHTPSMTADEYPVVNGSTATLPLSIELYRRVTGCSQAEAESRIEHTKTTDAYYRLIDEANVEGSVSLVLAYEPPQEIYDHMEESGIPLDIRPIGKDALVFMVNSGNPVSSLTEAQLIDIYTGRLKNWSRAGGREKEILAFQRPEHSGSQTLMEKLVMKEQAMEPAPSFQIVGEMGELIKKVASYNNQENAIGYSVYFYAQNMYQIPGLRFMGVDGVLPSNESIRDGSYPYVNEFYAAIREDEPDDSNARILFNWLTSDDGQRLIESLGYVSLETSGASGENAGKRSVQRQIPEEIGPGSIPLKEDERILLDGRFAYGTDGVYILNGKMEQTEKLEEVGYPDRSGIVRLSEPVLMADLKTGRRGLYAIREKKWVLKPVYDTLFFDEEAECFKGYRWDEQAKTEERTEITVNGGEITIEDDTDNRLGDNLWDVKDSLVTITGPDGAVVASFDLRKDRGLSPGYFYAPYYVASDADGDCVLLDADGKTVFSKADLDPAFLSEVKKQEKPSGFDSIQIQSISGDGGWFEGFVGYGSSLFVYDLKSRKITSRPGDEIEAYISGKDSAYTLTRDGETSIYNAEGGPLLSWDGRRLEYIMGRSYYGYLEDGRLMIVDNQTHTRYELNTENMELQAQNIGYSIAKDTFFIMDQEGYSVWQRDKCLVSSPLVSWWRLGDYVVISDEEQKNIVLRESDGEILYRSKVPEYILQADGAMMAVYRGSYFYLIGFDGEYALRLLRAELMDD